MRERGARRGNTLTASVAVVRPMLMFARTRGVPVEALLRDVGLTVSMLDDYDRRIPEDTRSRLWTEAAALSRDPTFGLHVAEQTKVGEYDVLGYALDFSSTLGEMLDRIIRFHRVLCDAWAVSYDVHRDVARIRRVVRTPPAEAEASFALLTLRARALTGVHGTPREVRFAHRAPADTTPYTALFGCPVRFGRSSSELLTDVAARALPLRTPNPGVVRILDRYMSEILDRLPKSDAFVDRVRAAVGRGLPAGRPTLETTARELHASRRTVQRRLQEHGTSHAEVVDLVRHEMAERLVSDDKLSITEIAFLVGFTDVSGFRRVYKRWTGAAPSHGRRRT